MRDAVAFDRYEQGAVFLTSVVILPLRVLGECHRFLQTLGYHGGDLRILELNVGRFLQEIIADAVTVYIAVVVGAQNTNRGNISGRGGVGHQQSARANQNTEQHAVGDCQPKKGRDRFAEEALHAAGAEQLKCQRGKQGDDVEEDPVGNVVGVEGVSGENV